MSKTLAILATAAMAVVCRAQAPAQFVIVTPEGIIPDGAVSTMNALADLAAGTVALAVQADTLSNAVVQVNNKVAAVTAQVDALEGIMYWDGFVLDYGVAEEISEDYDSRIVGFAVASNDVAYVYSEVWAHFTRAPDTLPAVHFSTSLTREGDWDEAYLVSIVEDELLVGSTLFECYRILVRVDAAYATAYFRVVSAPLVSSAGANLPVDNGIMPGGMEPLTGTWIVDGQTIAVKGGVRVQPAE